MNLGEGGTVDRQPFGNQLPRRQDPHRSSQLPFDHLPALVFQHLPRGGEVRASGRTMRTLTIYLQAEMPVAPYSLESRVCRGHLSRLHQEGGKDVYSCRGHNYGTIAGRSLGKPCVSRRFLADRFPPKPKVAGSTPVGYTNKKLRDQRHCSILELFSIHPKSPVTTRE